MYLSEESVELRNLYENIDNHYNDKAYHPTVISDKLMNYFQLKENKYFESVYFIKHNHITI